MQKAMIMAILFTVGALGAFAQGNYQELKDKAQGLCNAQQWKDAEKVLKDAMNAASNDKEKSEALLLLANCHFYSNSLDKAEQDVEKLLALKIENTQAKIKVLTLQAQIYSRTKRHEQAFKSYEIILALPELEKSDRFSALLGKAEALMFMDKREETLPIIEQVVSDGDASSDIKALALLLKFHIQCGQGMKDEARKALEDVINSPASEGLKDRAKILLKDMKKD